MKKLVLSLALIFFGLAAPAWARVMTFENLYTIDVPVGWEVSEKEGILILLSPDRRAVFLITRGLSVKAHKQKIASERSQYESLAGDNDREATINRIQGLRVVVTILGDHPDRVPMYYSIEAK